jgi:multidrug efflux pump subunit AcrA (membrane-fusion protein)
MGKATVGDLTLSIPASGSLSGSGTQTVVAAGKGEIADMLVSSGDTVSQGDVLAVIDTSAISDEIDALYDQINTVYESIDSARSTTDNFFVKAAADGTLKSVMVERTTWSRISWPNTGIWRSSPPRTRCWWRNSPERFRPVSP